MGHFDRQHRYVGAELLVHVVVDGLALHEKVVDVELLGAAHFHRHGLLKVLVEPLALLGVGDVIELDTHTVAVHALEVLLELLVGVHLLVVEGASMGCA